MLSDYDKNNFEEFITSISFWENAYRHSGLSYFAVRQDGMFSLAQARLFLHWKPSPAPATQFQSSTIRAGHYLLSELGGRFRDLIEQILTGFLPTPHGELCFLPDENKRYSVRYNPFYYEGLQYGTRIDQLVLTGSRQMLNVQHPRFDWEVKAASTPYDNINELFLEYNLGTHRSGEANIEVLAFHVAGIDLDSRINDTKAMVGIQLAHGLTAENCRLSYRVFHQGRIVDRTSVEGAGMRWEQRDQFQLGLAEINVPTGAILHCTAIYNGSAQHQLWVSDPSTVQNPYRAVYDVFDDKATILRDFLENSQSKGRDARDLETAVAWLLWMLGFGVAHLGATAKTKDAPDLVATTPRGNFAVIECTAGLLKADNKLPCLIERAEMLRRGLDISGNRQLTVLPVIVTSKTREDIKADLEQAESLGVVVITKESLQQALTRTLVLPNAESLYAEGLRTAREKKKK